MPRHTESPRLAVEGIHHPSGEINVDPLRIGANAPRFAEIEVFHDLLASIKLPRDIRVPIMARSATLTVQQWGNSLAVRIPEG